MHWSSCRFGAACARFLSARHPCNGALAAGCALLAAGCWLQPRQRKQSSAWDRLCQGALPSAAGCPRLGSELWRWAPEALYQEAELAQMLLLTDRRECTRLEGAAGAVRAAQRSTTGRYGLPSGTRAGLSTPCTPHRDRHEWDRWRGGARSSRVHPSPRMRNNDTPC